MNTITAALSTTMSDSSILWREHRHIAPPGVHGVNAIASTSVVKHSSAYLGVTKHNADTGMQNTSLQTLLTLQASPSSLEVVSSHCQQNSSSSCIRTIKHNTDMTIQIISTPKLPELPSSQSSLGVLNPPRQETPSPASLKNSTHDADISMQATSTRMSSTPPASPSSLAVLIPPHWKPPDKPTQASSASPTGKTRVTYAPRFRSAADWPPHLPLPPPHHTHLEPPLLPQDNNNGRGGGSGKMLRVVTFQAWSFLTLVSFTIPTKHKSA